MGIFGRKSDDTDTTSAAGHVNPDLAALTGDYTIDPSHTTLGFTARHAMVTNVKGKFLDFTGTLHLDGSDPAKSTASLDVKMDSIDTGSAGPRRSPQERGLLQDGRVPDDDLPLHLGRGPRRRRLPHHR
jgi:hypothetical protein